MAETIKNLTLNGAPIWPQFFGDKILTENRYEHAFQFVYLIFLWVQNPRRLNSTSIGPLDSKSKPPPYAIIEKDNTVIYRPERYAGEMLLDVTRYKGSTGAIKLAWGVTTELNTPSSFVVTPTSGEVEFSEGQWNSSIHLRFPFIPETEQEIGIFAKLLSVSDGAMLGNFTSVKIIFPPNVGDSEVTIPVQEDNSGRESNVILKILLPCLSGALLIVGTAGSMICLCKGRRR